MLINLDHVYAGYNESLVLEDVNLTVNDHDFIGVIGPNGGGKTTLIKVIAGLLNPIKGKVLLSSELDGGKRVGYLPQINHFDRQFPVTVLEVVLSGALNRRQWFGGFKDEVKDKAINLMEKTGISSVSKLPIGSLSGGQAQRAFLCRALMTDPLVLLLDEPTNFVDREFEKNLYQLLSELNESMAIVMVSHDLGIISSHVKTIACVNKTLHYHDGPEISSEQLAVYNCPIDLLAHGPVPHRVLKVHK